MTRAATGFFCLTVLASTTCGLSEEGRAPEVDPDGRDDDPAPPGRDPTDDPIAPAPHTGRFIVVLRPQIGAGAFLAAPRRAPIGATHVYVHALSGFAAELSPAELADLARDPEVAWIEPELVLSAVGELEPGVARIGAPSHVRARIDGIDGPGERVDVDVAILDSGIDLGHGELDVVAEHNFIDPTGTGHDDNGHGTHVAGIVGALDDGSGVVGVAPGARLWALKVLGSNGNGTMADILEAVDWVTAHADEIEVANLSLGGWGQSPSLRQAIRVSVARGVVYVAAAGNDGVDLFGTPPQPGGTGIGADFIPGAFSEVAAVSAMIDSDGLAGGLGPATVHGPDDRFAPFSNHAAGSDPGNPFVAPGGAIDLAAPGSMIRSTLPGGAHGFASGTSMAAPHVAGAVALWIAHYGRAIDAPTVAAVRAGLIALAQPQAAWGPPPSGDPDSNPEPLVDVAEADGPLPICGDGMCDGGEACSTCAGDCGVCPACGNGMADGTELCDGVDLRGVDCVDLGKGWQGGVLGCAVGCDAFDESRCRRCGDGTCHPDEGCASCPADCGGCPGDLELFRDDFQAGLAAWTESGEGDWNTEPLHGALGYPVGASGAPAAHSDDCDTSCTLTSRAIDLRGLASARVELLRFVDQELDTGEFLRIEAGAGASFVTLAQWGGGSGDDDRWHAEFLDLGAVLGGADVRIRLVTKANGSIEHVHVDDVRVVGISADAPVCGDLSCAPAETCSGCPVDCGACPPACGDGTCDPGESCSGCPVDCGACPPACGDGTCGPSESCSGCPVDCGACPPACGDGTCDPTETCSGCAQDCGACPPACGDGTCDPTETCGGCAQDCGACPPVCGDGTCAPTESCAVCPTDCGVCSPPGTVFFDDFGSGLGKWTESGEGDWNTEPLHAATGYPGGGSAAPAAHSDDCDTGCTLTLASPIDLRGATSARVELLRFVDHELDSGEFLRVEAGSGASFVTLGQWGAGSGDDDQWHAETLDLAPLLGQGGVRIRLVTLENGATEHVHVDDLRVVVVR